MIPLRPGILIALIAYPVFAQTDITLSGTVTDAITHLPIADAHIVWCCGLIAGNTKTDGTWRLQIKSTNFGGNINVAKIGYADAQLAVYATSVSRTLDFELHKAAHLRGHVVDRDTGEPLAGFAVLAAYKGLQSALSAAKEPSAADGSFEITADLSAGDYTVEVDPPAGARIVSRIDGPDLPDYGRSYFPDVPRAEMASPVTLSDGENRDLELRLHKRELHHIAGVFQLPAGLETNPINISVTPSGRLLWPLVTGLVSKSGSFRIDGLDEGTYHLASSAVSASGNSAAYGGQAIEITNRSIDDLKIAMRSGIIVRAEVTMAEDHAEPPKGLQLAVTAFPAPFFAGVKNGFIRLGLNRMSLDGYPPGEYWPTLTVPAGYVVASVSFNGAPVFNSPVDLESAESVIKFVLTSRPASVSGIVRDGNQKAMPGAIVVLLPAVLPDLLERLDRAAIRVSFADGNGAFHFGGLPPGKYRATTLAGADRERSRDLAFVVGQANSPIELDFGQNATVDLPHN